MGIQNLLGFLSEFVEEIELDSGHRHKVVGVDAHIWLYKGAQCFPYQLAMGLPCNDHIKYFVKQVEKLIQIGAKPILLLMDVYPK